MLSTNLINLLLIVTFTILTTVSSTNYCSNKLCPGKRNHIGCKNDGNFCDTCPKNSEVIPMTDEFQCFIVDKHNEIRRGVSEGNYKGLKNANRMIEMVR